MTEEEQLKLEESMKVLSATGLSLEEIFLLFISGVCTLISDNENMVTVEKLQSLIEAKHSVKWTTLALENLIKELIGFELLMKIGTKNYSLTPSGEALVVAYKESYKMAIKAQEQAKTEGVIS